MSHRHPFRFCFIVIGLVLFQSTAQAGIITAGDLYTSDNFTGNVIRHYTASGAYVESFSVPSSYGTSVRGMALGPDSLFYATVANGSSGFNVVALNSAGAVQKTYSGPEYVAGGTTSGRIAFANNGQFFVAGHHNLRRFSINNPDGTVVYTNNGVYDATALPSGNLLVLSAYQLDEITPNGLVVRTIKPNGSIIDARGVAYNAATDDIYVTMLGHSAEQFRIMRLNGQTGAVEKNVSYIYADDLFLTSDNKLLVGSGTLDVGIFDLDLNQIGSLAGGSQSFVTRAVAVPELGSMVLASAAVLGGITYSLFERRRQATTLRESASP
jgi:hypothetical protein